MLQRIIVFRCLNLARVLAVVVCSQLSMIASADLDGRQMQLLTAKCVQCHAVPHTGAPLMGKADEWRAVLAQGEEQTLINVVEGIRGMPPLGYCSACSEADFRALIRFMAGFPQPTTEVPR